VLTIREQGLGPNHPDVARALRELAYLIQITGDRDAARSLNERAIRIFEKTFGPDNPEMVTSLGGLAFIEWESGRPNLALPMLIRAITGARMHIYRGLVGLSVRQKLGFIERMAPWIAQLFNMPPGYVREEIAYGVLLDWKNLLFRTLVEERTPVEEKPGPVVAALLQDYTRTRKQLAAAYLTTPALSSLQEYWSRVQSLTRRVEELEGELSQASATFSRARAVEKDAPLADVCAAVPRDAALIELLWYSRSDPLVASSTPTPGYVVFVLRGGECANLIRVELGPAVPIDNDVRRFREVLSREATDLADREQRARYRTALAARLKAKLFPPKVQAAIKGKSRLLISPDGAMALLPFGLLPGEDGHEFLLETRTISYVPSGRDLLRTAVPSSTPSGLLAVGAPAFDRVPVQVAQAGTLRAGCGTPEDPFAPIPGTGAEVRAITRTYQQTRPTGPLTVLEGAQATKAAFLEQAPKAGVLHLATHAYFAGEDCTPAGLVSEQRGLGGEPSAFLGHNPLLLAGIALTGANDREKGNGILTALEVTALDLRGTDLVVLSACDTGLGTRARGQELLGLRWAFAYAGARNLVISLWSVPDAETATLMTHFYTALWERGLSVPAALRSAQLEMLRAARTKGDSAPHTWGAFVASGRPD
jgi:CHAT domain-containing protein